MPVAGLLPRPDPTPRPARAAMSVSESYLEFLMERLRPAVPGLRPRRMFGAVGLYADTVFFAVVDDDVLYFKVDDASRPAYERAGMQPFSPYGDDAKPMQYWSVPADVLEDDAALADWADTAIAVGRASGAKRRGR